MVKLYEKRTHRYLGRISDEELQFLIDNLEMEAMSGNPSGSIEDVMGDNREVETDYEKL